MMIPISFPVLPIHVEDYYERLRSHKPVDLKSNNVHSLFCFLWSKTDRFDSRFVIVVAVVVTVVVVVGDVV